MKKLFVFLIMLMLVSFAQDGFAQKKRKREKKSKHTVTVELADGTKISGMLDRMSADTLYMKNETLGALKFALSDVSYTSDAKHETGPSGEPVIERVNEYNINYDQYMFAASAFNIDESYYQNRSLFLQTVGVRVKENISIYATVEPISSIIYKTFNFAVGGKASTSFNQNMRGALGVNLFAVEGSFAIMPYGVLTFGSKRKNISINARYAFAGVSGDINGGGFILGASGGYQFNNRLSAIGELHLFSGGVDSPPLVGFAIRRHGKYSGSAFDFGLYVVSNDEFNFPFPYLAYSTPLR